MFDLKAALWVKVLRPNMHWLGRSPESLSLSESPRLYEAADMDVAQTLLGSSCTMRRFLRT